VILVTESYQSADEELAPGQDKCHQCSAPAAAFTTAAGAEPKPGFAESGKDFAGQSGAHFARR